MDDKNQTTPVEENTTEEPKKETEKAQAEVTGDAPEQVVPKTEEAPAEELPDEKPTVSNTKEIEDFRVGDTVKVTYKIVEGGKTRLQPFEGIVISKKGAGESKTFTVRKIGADNIGVERIFPLFSPNINKLIVTKKGKVRRAKLYYLRGRKGRSATRIKAR